MQRNRLIFRIWRLGFVDGWQQHDDLCWGMTWDTDQTFNEVYDRGVNSGQRAWRLAHPWV